MDYLITFALIIAVFLAIACVAYTLLTNKIIKDQQEDIEILKTDNERLRAELRALNTLKEKTEPVTSPSVTFHIINPKGKQVLEDLFKEW